MSIIWTGCVNTHRHGTDPTSWLCCTHWVVPFMVQVDVHHFLVILLLRFFVVTVDCCGTVCSWCALHVLVKNAAYCPISAVLSCMAATHCLRASSHTACSVCFRRSCDLTRVSKLVCGRPSRYEGLALTLSEFFLKQAKSFFLFLHLGKSLLVLV